MIINTSTILGIVGCNKGSDYLASVVKTLEKLSEQAANSKARKIKNAAKLKSDITSFLGDANGKPIPLEDGHSVQDVTDRTGHIINIHKNYKCSQSELF